VKYLQYISLKNIHETVNLRYASLSDELRDIVRKLCLWN